VIDLLASPLADVGDDQAAAGPVEREAPRVAQSRGPDLVPSRDPDVRVAGGDRVGGLGRKRFDSKQLAEQGLEVLSRVEGVTPAAAVADRDIEVAVRPELDLTAVVVAVDGVADRDDLLANQLTVVMTKGIDMDVSLGAPGRDLAGVGGVEAAGRGKSGAVAIERRPRSLTQQLTRVCRSAKTSGPASPTSTTTPSRSATKSRSGSSGSDVTKIGRSKFPTDSRLAASAPAAPASDSEAAIITISRPRRTPHIFPDRNSLNPECGPVQLVPPAQRRISTSSTQALATAPTVAKTMPAATQ
jgi:hypothetical protein